jgi:elongation factor 2
MYKRFDRVIDQVNVVISTYQHEEEEEIILDPTKGNVLFGAGKDQWAFSLETMAHRYNKHDEAAKVFMSRLWGDHFYDEETKKWHETEEHEGKHLKRGFVKFAM